MLQLTFLYCNCKALGVSGREGETCDSLGAMPYYFWPIRTQNNDVIYTRGSCRCHDRNKYECKIPVFWVKAKITC